jgi:hypothetical protein
MSWEQDYIYAIEWYMAGSEQIMKNMKHCLVYGRDFPLCPKQARLS